MISPSLPAISRDMRMPLAMLSGVAATIAGGYGLIAPEVMLSNGFDAAMADHARPATLAGTAGRAAERDGVLLRTTSIDGSAGSGRTFVVGDRISMHGKDGRDASYEIVDVHDIEPTAVRDRTIAGPRPRLLLVTARPAVAQSSLRPLRFVVEADDADAAQPITVVPRAL